MEKFSQIEQRYYFFDLSNKNLNSEINEFLELKENGHPSLKFIYLFNEENLLDDDIENKINQKLSILMKKISVDDFVISFDHQIKDELNNNETCKKLAELENKFKNINMGLESEFRTWNIKEIVNANNKIDEIVNEIKKQNLSSVEAFMKAYMFVTNRLFIDRKNNSSIPRTVYGVLNSDEIVCVGFCELLKEIMNRLGYKNIKLFSNNVESVIINEVCDKHRNLILYLKDEKYNLDGFYYIDPTWDAKGKNEEFKFNFFMLPLNEVENINEYDIFTENVKYSGFEEVTGHEKNLSYYCRPQQNNKISLGENSAVFCKEFIEFLKTKKEFIDKLNLFDQSENNTEYFAKNNSQQILNILKENTKNLNLKTFYKILKNVISKQYPDFSKKEKDKKIEDIIKYNIKVSRLCFNDNAKTIFRQLEPNSKVKQELNK